MAINNLQRLILNSVKKEEDIPSSFLNDLKYTIIKHEEQNNQKPSLTYKPSSMRCIRNMYFQRTGADIDDAKVNPSLVSIAESGTARHESIQRWISKMSEFGIDCEWVDVEKYLEEKGIIDNFDILSKYNYETKIEHKFLHIRFLCDGIIKYKNEYYIVEIKTETSSKWQSRKEINTEHVEQGTAYSTLLQINKVLFIYENRDFCDWKCFILNVTDGMKLEHVINPIKECELYISKNEVPPIPSIADNKFCRYCNYKNVCKISRSEINV